VNDRELIPPGYTNSLFINVLMVLIVGVTCLLGLNNIWKALARIIPALAEWPAAILINLALSGLIMVVLGWRVLRR
jgi:hypothetical protein